jgi:ABC-type transporter Mla subunit MlaD
MLSERPRNIIVGLTFIAALSLCMYGIVLLGKFQSIGGLRQYPVILMANNANGVGAGAKVEMNGIYSGQIESTWLADNGQGELVAYLKMNIDLNVNIPVSATASLQRPLTMGNPYVDIQATDSKGPFLAKEGRPPVLAAVAAESNLIPKEVFEDIRLLKGDLTTLSHQLGTVAQDLHVLLVYTPPEAVENANPNDPNRPRVNASTAVIRLDRTIASLQQLLGDPKLQGQVRTIVQNIAEASERLKSTLEKVDTMLANANAAATNIGTAVTSAAGAFGSAATQAASTLQATQKDINRVSQQLIETLAQLEKSSRDITSGSGTTGKLVTDPRLYENLVDLSRSLKKTVDDLDFLVNKVKDEGIDLRLK